MRHLQDLARTLHAGPRGSEICFRVDTETNSRDTIVNAQFEPAAPSQYEVRRDQRQGLARLDLEIGDAVAVDVAGHESLAVDLPVAELPGDPPEGAGAPASVSDSTPPRAYPKLEQ